MPDFLPRRESDLISFLEVFVNWVVLNQVALGLTVQQVNDLVAAHTALLASWSAYLAAQDGAESATADKNTTKAAVIEIVRMTNTLVHANPAVTPAMLEAGGLLVYDETPTPLPQGRIMEIIPPVLEVTCPAPQTVSVVWHPSEIGTDSLALPAGVEGISIYVADKATDGTLGPYQWIGLDSNSPYHHSVGNTTTVTRVYRAQWYDRNKRFGPFGDPVEVAVTA